MKLAQLPTSRSTQNKALIAILGYTAAFMIFPVSDALAKRLASRYPIAEIAAVRFGVHFLIVCGTVFFWHGKTVLRTSRSGLHLVRGALMVGSTLAIFAALRTAALADVTIILFSTPLMVVALSRPLLGERIAVGQWLAVGAGLAGVLLIVQPAALGGGSGLMFAIVAAACGALYQLVSRRLSHTERPLVGLFYVTFVGTTALGALALPQWRMPAGEDWSAMLAMGVIAAAAYFAIFKAIEIVSPARLAPYFYAQILTASALGYYMFGDVPDAWAVLGMLLISGAGLVCVGLERRRERVNALPLRID